MATAEWPSPRGSGRSASRPADRVALTETAAASGRQVVVIVAGSAVLVEGWREQASAIQQTFYSGMEGGTALARLLVWYFLYE